MNDIKLIFDVVNFVMHIKMNILGFTVTFWNLFIYFIVAFLLIYIIRRIFF